MPTPETSENMVTTRRLASFATGIWTKITTALGLKANLESPAFTGTPTAPTAAVGTDSTQIATTAFVQTAIGTVAEAMLYKGAVNANSDLPDGSTTAKKYKAGWTYKVATAGTYAGKVCEVGDLIIANKNYGTGASANDWDVIQTNIDGAVTGPASSVSGNIPVFSGTTGKVIGDSGRKPTDIVPTPDAADKVLASGANGTYSWEAPTKSTWGTTSSATLLTAFKGTSIGAARAIADQNGNDIDATYLKKADEHIAFITTATTYAEVGALVSAGKIPVLVEQEQGSGRTLYYTYGGMRGDTYMFGISEEVRTYLPGGGEPVSTNVELFIQNLSPTGWHWNHSISENTANRVRSWDDVDAEGYKYPSAKLVKDSLDAKAAAGHTHGNITNDGKIGSTADLAVVTGSAGAVTTANLATSSPETGTGSAFEFIDTISQDSRGKITATKKPIRAASTSQAGVVQLATSIGATGSDTKAATEKAVRDALDANGKGIEIITMSATYSDIAAIIAANRTPILQVPISYENDVVVTIYAHLVQSSNSNTQGGYMFSAVIGVQEMIYTRPNTGNWVTDIHDLLPKNGALKIGLNGGTAASKFTANQSTDSTLTFATGSANGTIAVDGTDVSVKGLGTAAYTAATDYATSDHTHTTTLATSSGTATVTVTPGSKYQLTAGGTSVIFDIPETSDAEVTAILAELT